MPSGILFYLYPLFSHSHSISTTCCCMINSVHSKATVNSGGREKKCTYLHSKLIRIHICYNKWFNINLFIMVVKKDGLQTSIGAIRQSLRIMEHTRFTKCVPNVYHPIHSVTKLWSEVAEVRCSGRVDIVADIWNIHTHAVQVAFGQLLTTDLQTSIIYIIISRVGNTRRSCGQFLVPVTFLSDPYEFDLRRSCWPVPFLTLYKFFWPHLFAWCTIRKKISWNDHAICSCLYRT